MIKYQYWIDLDKKPCSATMQDNGLTTDKC